MSENVEVMVFEKDLLDNTTEVRVVVGEQVFKEVFDSPMKQSALDAFIRECFITVYPTSIIENVTQTGSYSVN